MKKNSKKNIRINAEVTRELNEIIHLGVKDPRLSSEMITVTSATVTPDLKYCKAYISVLGDDSACEEVRKGLDSASGYIRSELAKRVNLRNTPELTFIIDQSIGYAAYMSQKIDEVTKDLKDEEEIS